MSVTDEMSLRDKEENSMIADTSTSSVEFPNVQVSDTTDDDSSNTAGQIKNTFLQFYLTNLPTLALRQTGNILAFK